MTMIYLEHPQHGIKIAYLEAEAAADEKNGWTRCAPVGSTVPIVPSDPVEPEKPVRRGRPPKQTS